jgi:hypothetical protein
VYLIRPHTLRDRIRFGIIHLAIQGVAGVIVLGEIAFYLPLALSERPGQLYFGLWLFLNVGLIGITLRYAIDSLAQVQHRDQIKVLMLPPLAALMTFAVLKILDHEFIESIIAAVVVFVCVLVGEYLIRWIERRRSRRHYLTAQ